MSKIGISSKTMTIYANNFGEGEGVGFEVHGFILHKLKSLPSRQVSETQHWYNRRLNIPINEWFFKPLHDFRMYLPPFNFWRRNSEIRDLMKPILRKNPSPSFLRGENLLGFGKNFLILSLAEKKTPSIRSYETR